MAYTTINKSTDYFNTKLYTGNGGTQAMTGVGFQPDWVWTKCRNDSHNHNIFDAVRGITKRIHSDTTASETTNAESLKSFDSDGFTMGTQTNVNQNSGTYASWNWKANGTGSANTDGSISSTVSANTTSGFSIVKYTGTGSAGTIGHGLGTTPDFIITKRIDGTDSWMNWNKTFTATQYLQLNETNAVASASTVFGTLPTSTVYSTGGGTATGANGGNFISYCFAEKQGYSKFGSYVGNGNTDGPFNYCGFKPAFVMAKKTSATGGWQLRDNKRTPTGNLTNNLMYANASSTEQTTDGVDFLSNGWKLKNSAGDSNASGATYIFMAFAEAPLVGTNGVTAKAR